MEQAVLTSVLNVGGVGVLAAALIWIVIPRILDHFSKAQAAMLEFHGQQMAAIRNDHNDHIEKLVGRLERVEIAVRDLAERPFRQSRPEDRR